MDSIPSPVTNRSGENDSYSSSIKCKISCRYSMAFMGCLGGTIAFIIRANLNVALVAMVNSTDTTSQDSYGKLEGTQQRKEFTWTEETQGVILSSLYYGYVFTQLPGGWMASRFSGKHVFGTGILISAILTLLTPWAAGQGIGAFIAVRVLEGVALGVTYPAVNVLLSSWSPPHEKSMMATIIAIGCSLGTIIAQSSAGVLCASGFLDGWPSVFYVSGLLGILWYFAWLLLVFEKPASHPRISEHEKHYILLSIGKSQDQSVKARKVPWVAILKSAPVHAIIFCCFCSGWTFYTFLTTLPSYYKEVLGLKIVTNGFVSSIPYIVAIAFNIVIAWLADRLITRQICSVGEVRKLATISGLVIPACLLIATSYVGKDGEILGISLISLSIIMNITINVGSAVNQLDIAPRFAGIIMAIGNIFSTISGVISPLVTGWLTNDEPTRGQWQKVFYISALISISGAVIFVVFGSGKEQKWNSSNNDLVEDADFVRESRTPLLHAGPPQEHYQSIN